MHPQQFSAPTSDPVRRIGHGHYQIFPDLTDEQLEELKADIAKHGPVTPVEFDEDGNIIDGHQRMRAFLELGIDDYPRITRIYQSEEEKWERVVALNMHRRHLNRAEKDRVIRELLTRFPQWSASHIARAAQVDTHTVTARKEEMEAQGMEFPRIVEKRREVVAEIVREHPHLKAPQIATLMQEQHPEVTASINTVRAIKKELASGAVSAKPGKAKKARPSRHELLTINQFKTLKRSFVRATVEAQQLFREFLSASNH